MSWIRLNFSSLDTGICQTLVLGDGNLSDCRPWGREFVRLSSVGAGICQTLFLGDGNLSDSLVSWDGRQLEPKGLVHPYSFEFVCCQWCLFFSNCCF